MVNDNNAAEQLAPTLAKLLQRNGLEQIMAQMSQHPDVINAIEAEWGSLSEVQQRQLVRVAVEEVTALPELATMARKLSRQRSGIVEAATGFLDLLPLFVFLAGVRTKADIKIGKFGRFEFEYHGDVKHLTNLVRSLLSKQRDD